MCFKAYLIRIGYYNFSWHCIKDKIFFWYCILDKILRLDHCIELLNFCKGLKQANLLPSPSYLCDLEEKKLVNQLHWVFDSSKLSNIYIHPRGNLYYQVLI